MAQVITFEDFQPIPRYDLLPWTEARIEESDSALLSDDTVWTELETIALSPVDADPADPASRDFTTELASDEMELWYRIVFVDGNGDESLPTAPIQNTDPSDASAYASVNELMQVLKIRTPTDDQLEKGERALVAAAGEINSEIDLDDDTSLSGWQLALCAEVNIDRAVEHWNQKLSPFGLVNLGSELGATPTARDSWQRHATKLAPLKDQWGFA